MTRVRLQKILAASGLGSRRACEELILTGRVSVDGIPVTAMGTTVDPDIQKITFDGNRISLPKKHYFLVNKPVGYVCSSRTDRSGRPLVTDLVRIPGIRLFTVGRLDVDSKGAIILTNDGEFSNVVSHPRYDVPKTYRVRVRGQLDAETVEKLRQGIWLAEGKTTPTEVKVIRSTRTETILRMTVKEGKNRIIRRILARINLKVTELERTRIGAVALGSLKAGAYRRLSAAEVKKLSSDATRSGPTPKSSTRDSAKRRSQSRRPPQGQSRASRRPSSKGRSARRPHRGTSSSSSRRP